MTFLASEKFGLTDFVVDYEVWKGSFLGEWAKNIMEDFSTANRILYDAALGAGTSVLSYVGLVLFDELRN